ncbi:MAG: hypothetical protein J6R77_04410 [Clostridia bacterium]|nr:hypothetical protein [Clostridia bacterium]
MKHRGVWLTTILALIVLGAVCVAGGVVLMLRPAESPAEADTPTTPTTIVIIDSYPWLDGTLTDAEKVAFNERIDQELVRPIEKMFGYQLRDMQFDVDVFASPENCAHFAWQVAVSDPDVPEITDIDEKGNEVTGGVAIRPADYSARYAKIFGESGDVAALLRAKPAFVLQGDYIYGSRVTGWGIEDFVLKATAFEANENGRYTLTMDMLTRFVERTESDGDTYTAIDEELVATYDKAELLDYPADMVYAQVTLDLTASEDGYILESLYFTKPT